MFHVLFERGNIRLAVGLSGWILPTGILDVIGRRVQTEHEHPWSNSGLIPTSHILCHHFFSSSRNLNSLGLAWWWFSVASFLADDLEHNRREPVSNP
jgi:hypothetical protein